MPEAVWRELVRDALRSLGVWLLGAVFGLVPPAAVVLTLGWQFVTTNHVVPGWAILISTGCLGVGLFGGGLGILPYFRVRGRRHPLSAIAEGYPYSLNWSMGAQMTAAGNAPQMLVAGDFVLTNSTNQHIYVPRSVLLVRYGRFGMWLRRRIEGSGVGEPIPARSSVRERMYWSFGPPVLQPGQPLSAKAGFIDQFGREHWSRWHKYKGFA